MSAAGSVIRVLLVEDDEDDFILTRDLLREIEPQRYELAWARSYAEGRAAIAEGGYDLHLIDYRLGERDGLQLIREALADGCTAPLLLLTGQADASIDQGASCACSAASLGGPVNGTSATIAASATSITLPSVAAARVAPRSPSASVAAPISSFATKPRPSGSPAIETQAIAAAAKVSGITRPRPESRVRSRVPASWSTAPAAMKSARRAMITCRAAPCTRLISRPLRRPATYPVLGTAS